MIVALPNFSAISKKNNDRMESGHTTLCGLLKALWVYSELKEAIEEMLAEP